MKWVKSLVPTRERGLPMPAPVQTPPDWLAVEGWPSFDYRAILPASAIRPGPPSRHPEVAN